MPRRGSDHGKVHGMSRLRIQLSKSEIDRKVASSVTDVERILLSALRDCDRYMRSTKNPVEATRARGVIRDLKKVLGAVSGVRRVSPVYDITDEDLQPTKAAPKRPAVPTTPPTV